MGLNQYRTPLSLVTKTESWWIPNDHGFGVERKEKALGSGVVGGNCLQEVWNHQKLYLDLRKSEGGFQLRKGLAQKHRSWVSYSTSGLEQVCYLSRLRNKTTKANSLMMILNSKPKDGQRAHQRLWNRDVTWRKWCFREVVCQLCARLHKEEAGWKL